MEVVDAADEAAELLGCSVVVALGVVAVLLGLAPVVEENPLQTLGLQWLPLTQAAWLGLDGEQQTSILQTTGGTVHEQE